MKTVILSGTNSRNAGGIFNSARMLGLNLSKYCGVDIHYLMNNDEYSLEDVKYYEPLPMHTYSVIGAKSLGYSSDLYSKLSTIKPDLVHTQTLWMYLSYVNNMYSKKTKTPYVISPRGMLDPWQLKQGFIKDIKKKIVLFLYEKEHLDHASCIHALCQNEYIAIREFGIKAPVAIIPNGVDLPLLPNGRKREPEKKGRKSLLFLSRIHPKKGLQELLTGWALTQPQHHDWELVIAGETKDMVYMNSLVQLSKALKIDSYVRFIGGQFGVNKRTTFLNSDAFILPSFSEGLPMAVLEAWSYQLPTLITPQCNLPEGFKHKAAIQIDPVPESIAEGINSLIRMSAQEQQVLSQNGYNLVLSKFTWEQVARDTFELYKWVTSQGEKPSFVYL